MVITEALPLHQQIYFVLWKQKFCLNFKAKEKKKKGTSSPDGRKSPLDEDFKDGGFQPSSVRHLYSCCLWVTGGGAETAPGPTAWPIWPAAACSPGSGSTGPWCRPRGSGSEAPVAPSTRGRSPRLFGMPLLPFPAKACNCWAYLA